MLFTVLATVVCVLDVLFMIAIMLFMKNLSWSKKENRMTIAGFTVMMAGAALNVGVLITLLRAVV